MSTINCAVFNFNDDEDGISIIFDSKERRVGIDISTDGEKAEVYRIEDGKLSKVQMDTANLYQPMIDALIWLGKTESKV